MIELNKARVSFKHYGNLPAYEDALKHESYTEQFHIVDYTLAVQNHIEY